MTVMYNAQTIIARHIDSILLYNQTQYLVLPEPYIHITHQHQSAFRVLLRLQVLLQTLKDGLYLF
uniref:Uncharacterized protein n=1 Tax=Siphoviridae sp. ctnFo11 TaxID=2826454 RepID=A0A8S5N4U7_9CAUD|nr:MAG TPA: hypothetical protein [Siphoviridae sp. ctnFo11]